MKSNFLHRMNVDFFRYEWREMYQKNKEAIQWENAVFTWNSLFFILVVDVVLTIFFSAIEDGQAEALRLAAILPIIVILFILSHWIYRLKLNYFLTVGVIYAVGTLMFIFCSYMIITPEVDTSFYVLFLIITLLTTLVVDVPSRKLAVLFIWNLMLVITEYYGATDARNFRTLFIHGLIVSFASYLFGCYTSWRKLKGFDSERELIYASTHDRLTNLHNREKLYIDFDELTEQQELLGVMIFDINSFKHLNDTYGHIFGDRAIQYVAEILSKCEDRYGIQFYRYGGDEFVGLVRRFGEDRPGDLIPHIKRAIAEEPISAVDGVKIRLQVSGGYVEFNRGDSLERCVNKADEAMYLDKEQMKKSGQVSTEV
ncbi:MAG: GGDEF domain-containing protein [Lachnospiraceae bacterium]|nr:GGDEF domain-containing protein [Lachnospiraceae bacterium]